MYYTGIWHTLRTLSIDEGILGLYKGLRTTLVDIGPSIAISFSVCESLRSYWMSNRPHDSAIMMSLACGSLSGIASSTEYYKVVPGVGICFMTYETLKLSFKDLTQKYNGLFLMLVVSLGLLLARG